MIAILGIAFVPFLIAVLLISGTGAVFVGGCGGTPAGRKRKDSPGVNPVAELPGKVADMYVDAKGHIIACGSTGWLADCITDGVNPANCSILVEGNPQNRSKVLKCVPSVEGQTLAVASPPVDGYPVSIVRFDHAAKKSVSNELPREISIGGVKLVLTDPRGVAFAGGKKPYVFVSTYNDPSQPSHGSILSYGTVSRFEWEVLAKTADKGAILQESVAIFTKWRGAAGLSMVPGKDQLVVLGAGGTDMRGTHTAGMTIIKSDYIDPGIQPIANYAFDGLVADQFSGVTVDGAGLNAFIAGERNGTSQLAVALLATGATTYVSLGVGLGEIVQTAVTSAGGTRVYAAASEGFVPVVNFNTAAAVYESPGMVGFVDNPSAIVGTKDGTVYVATTDVETGAQGQLKAFSPGIELLQPESAISSPLSTPPQNNADLADGPPSYDPGLKVYLCLPERRVGHPPSVYCN